MEIMILVHGIGKLESGGTQKVLRVCSGYADEKGCLGYGKQNLTLCTLTLILRTLSQKIQVGAINTC